MLRHRGSTEARGDYALRACYAGRGQNIWGISSSTTHEVKVTNNAQTGGMHCTHTHTSFHMWMIEYVWWSRMWMCKRKANAFWHTTFRWLAHAACMYTVVVHTKRRVGCIFTHVSQAIGRVRPPLPPTAVQCILLYRYDAIGSLVQKAIVHVIKQEQFSNWFPPFTVGFSQVSS